MTNRTVANLGEFARRGFHEPDGASIVDDLRQPSPHQHKSHLDHSSAAMQSIAGGCRCAVILAGNEDRGIREAASRCNFLGVTQVFLWPSA